MYQYKRAFLPIIIVSLAAVALGQSEESLSLGQLRKQEAQLESQRSAQLKAAQTNEAIETTVQLKAVQLEILSVVKDEEQFQSTKSYVHTLHWLFMQYQSQDKAELAQQTRHDVEQLLKSLDDELKNQKKNKQYDEAIKLGGVIQNIRARFFGEDDLEYASISYELGGLHLRTKQLAQSLRCYEKAYEIRSREWGKDDSRTAKIVKYIDHCLLKLAHSHRNNGEYSSAAPLYVKLREIRRKAWGNDHPRYAEILNSYALVREQMGEYAEAKELYQRAGAICEKALANETNDVKRKRTSLQKATYLNNLAALYLRMGEYSQAEPLHLKVLDLRREWLGKDNLQYGESLNNLGLLYFRLKKFDEAELKYKEACEICRISLAGENDEAKRQKKNLDYATHKNNLALLYMTTGELEKAEDLYQQVGKIRSAELGEVNADYAATLDQLAKLKRLQGDYQEAVDFHLRACEIYQEVYGKNHASYAWSLHRLGTTCFLNDQLSDAKEHWREVLEIKLSIALQTLPWLQEAQALLFLKELTTDDSSGGRDPLLSAYRALPNRTDQDVVDAYDAVWKTRGLVLRTLQGRRKRVADSPEAQDQLNELQAVQQQLAQLTLAPPPTDDQREVRRERLSKLNTEKEQLETKLARLSQSFRESREVETARPEDLVRQLSDGMAIVDLIKVNVWQHSTDGQHKPHKERCYEAFILNPANNDRGYAVTWVHLGSAEEIDKAIEAWRRQVQRDLEFARGRKLGTKKPSSVESDDTARRQLRELIWDKVEPSIAGYKDVLLIPDGELHRLPWAALPGREEGSFLLEEYGLTTASSGQQAYGLLSPLKSKSHSALLVGGVDYDKRSSHSASDQTAETNQPTLQGQTRADSWSYLPGTLREVEEISKLWSSSREPQILVSAEASETALRRLLPESTYVHFATHGFFADQRFRSMYGHDDSQEQLFRGSDGQKLVTAGRSSVTQRNPLLLSGVLLAGCNLAQATDIEGLPVSTSDDDGRMTAEELVNLDLRNTQLVVLSACETGLGKVGGGEGVFGLQRALHLAGARTTLATLWKVDDAATKALMVEFYKNLWQEKMSKLEALRQAQLTILYRYNPKTEEIEASKEPNKALAPPYYWSAFTLSGDWR